MLSLSRVGMDPIPEETDSPVSPPTRDLIERRNLGTCSRKTVRLRGMLSFLISFPLSVVSCKLSVVSCKLSVVSCKL